jgi:hypothetical protein
MSAMVKCQGQLKFGDGRPDRSPGSEALDFGFKTDIFMSLLPKSPKKAFGEISSEKA